MTVSQTLALSLKKNMEKRKQLTYTLPPSCTKSKNSPHIKKRRDTGERMHCFPSHCPSCNPGKCLYSYMLNLSWGKNWGKKLNTPKNICFMCFVCFWDQVSCIPSCPQTLLFLKLTLTLLPASSRGLGLQVYGMASGFCSVGDLTQGFMDARQTLLQLSYCSDPTFLFFIDSHLFQLSVAWTFSTITVEGSGRHLSLYKNQQHKSLVPKVSQRLFLGRLLG